MNTKRPTPPLIRACLNKAIEGDERCRAIWERWEKDADEDTRVEMLAAAMGWAHERLGGAA